MFPNPVPAQPLRRCRQGHDRECGTLRLGNRGCHYVNGHGAIDDDGGQVTFDLRATQSDNRASADFLSFCDPAAGVCLTNAEIRSVVISGNTAEFDGTAHLDDGTTVTYKVDVTDNGEQSALDTISIGLSDGYFASGNLTSGDIRID
ncbi:MAG: hypothetical protein H0W66_07960 [Chthoniobacterales bacterium]|nr:hypothetical protein [Chthoniobacterales bacterium]